VYILVIAGRTKVLSASFSGLLVQDVSGGVQTHPGARQTCFEPVMNINIQ
jgi:hypothetical protein